MKKDFQKEIMAKIKKENIKVKPRIYFQGLKTGFYILISILTVAAIYIFNLMFYLPSRTLRIAEHEGLAEYFALFPWLLIIVGAIIVGILVYLYRHHDGGYKKHLGITALVIFGVVLIGGMITARSNLNEKLEEQPHFQRFYDWNEDNFVPRGPRRRLMEPREGFIPEEKYF